MTLASAISCCQVEGPPAPAFEDIGTVEEQLRVATEGETQELLAVDGAADVNEGLRPVLQIHMGLLHVAVERQEVGLDRGAPTVGPRHQVVRAVAGNGRAHDLLLERRVGVLVSQCTVIPVLGVKLLSVAFCMATNWATVGQQTRKFSVVPAYGLAALLRAAVATWLPPRRRGLAPWRRRRGWAHDFSLGALLRCQRCWKWNGRSRNSQERFSSIGWSLLLP
jgi:hypothetical protein